MTHTIDLCSCNCGKWNQLSFTRQIRRQAKNFCPKPKVQSHGSCNSDVILRLTEVGATRNVQRSAEIAYGANDCCVDIYLRIFRALSVFERPSRNLILPLLLFFVPSHLEDAYDSFLDREIFHVAFVRQVAHTVAMETGKIHDHTKDAFYVFVTCGRYGGIGADGMPEFESVFSEEVSRHLSLEPHHPEFEQFRQTECRDCDIQEMAVDRLSRNTVSANGQIDRESMKRYLPRFGLGDVDRKLALYQDMALKLESTVVEEYRKLHASFSLGQDQAYTEVLPGHTGACSNACPRAKIWALARNEINIELQLLQ